ncbi:MAG TPA: SsgA family sporulation/cell division regulator, partial [Candidatus Nanopelagicales bacterium]|nr:SsgA family sporulation/cell division regulator [Candidatus Nanopelagicales bacterium]
AGLHASSGLGDVSLRPARRGLRATVVLTLASPSGQVALESDRDAIQAFLAQTYQLVAAGAEAARLDLDAALAQLLSQGQNPR